MKPTYREKNLLDYLFGGFRSTLKSQHVAVCYSVLQCVAVCVTECYRGLQCVPECRLLVANSIREARGSQGKPSSEMWLVSILTFGEPSIKFQTKFIGVVKSIMVPFFLEDVLYIKRTSHVSISVSTRMTLER